MKELVVAIIIAVIIADSVIVGLHKSYGISIDWKMIFWADFITLAIVMLFVTLGILI